MAANDDDSVRRSEWLDRAWRARLVLSAAAMAFAGLWAFGLLAGLPAAACFVAVAAAAFIGVGRGPQPPVRIPVEIDERPRDPPIDKVLAGISDPVVALNPDGEVVALNGWAAAIAPALRPGDPLSRGMRDPEILDAVRRALAIGASQRAEFFIRGPVERCYEAIVTPLALVANPPPAALVIMTFHDLTPLRIVEEMRADFVANASHELRTPLASLSGFIETLLGPARDDQEARERFLGIMQAQATRMARLIDDLLSLSRIELNAHVYPDKEVDLVPIVRQVADGLQPLARDRGVDVHVDAPAGQFVVKGDRDELLRVFENLVENALKYAASGKRVDIWLARDEGREVRVAVRDQGPGIAPEHLPRLTERFYRVDVSESRAQGGTGLGLALVKHILNRHGGRLTIDSTLGQGATFTAHLPPA
jgi:two-component system, OmpR family, phosphate regulon sensor histidine kinase PhoR